MENKNRQLLRIKVPSTWTIPLCCEFSLQPASPASVSPALANHRNGHRGPPCPAKQGKATTKKTTVHVKVMAFFVEKKPWGWKISRKRYPSIDFKGRNIVDKDTFLSLVSGFSQRKWMFWFLFHRDPTEGFWGCGLWMLANGRPLAIAVIHSYKQVPLFCPKIVPKVVSSPSKTLKKIIIWLVVSTHLKNISQIGNLPQIGVKIKNIWNHHLDDVCFFRWLLKLKNNPWSWVPLI